MNEKDLIKIINIADHYGERKQVIKSIEEYAELIQVLVKYSLIKNKDYDDQAPGLIARIKEEIADTYIMTAQLVYLLSLDMGHIEELIDRKLDRQLERIANEH